MKRHAQLPGGRSEGRRLLVPPLRLTEPELEGASVLWPLPSPERKLNFKLRSTERRNSQLWRAPSSHDNWRSAYSVDASRQLELRCFTQPRWHLRCQCAVRCAARLAQFERNELEARGIRHGRASSLSASVENHPCQFSEQAFWPIGKPIGKTARPHTVGELMVSKFTPQQAFVPSGRCSHQQPHWSTRITQRECAKIFAGDCFSGSFRRASDRNLWTNLRARL